MAVKKPGVLIVDDEQVICNLLQTELNEHGYQCTAVLDGKDALDKLTKENFEVVLLDIKLPGMSGMDVLHEIWQNNYNTAAIMITAVNDVDTAVEAMKLGAMDYIVKPFDLDVVNNVVNSALKTRQATTRPSTRMDAIARGVETKLDPLSSQAHLVRERTIDIARKLNIAEEEIQQWVTEKTKLDSQKESIIRHT